jgi:hypothetical protein
LKTSRMPMRTSRSSTPMIHRNAPETVGPIRPVAECSHEPSSATRARQAADPEREADGEQEDDRRVPER